MPLDQQPLIDILLSDTKDFLQNQKKLVKLSELFKIKNWGRPRIEPGTSRTLNENHATRPTTLNQNTFKNSFCCLNKKNWGRPRIEPGTSRTLNENHATRPTTLNQYDIQIQKNSFLFFLIKILQNCITKIKKNWGRPRIEPGTSRTLNENHATRPTTLNQNILIFYNQCGYF
ncbi:hypothetical protein ABPG73_005900 [Tetrahymena malaccensis]